jgi:hypothetical protein
MTAVCFSACAVLILVFLNRAKTMFQNVYRGMGSMSSTKLFISAVSSVLTKDKAKLPTGILMHPEDIIPAQLWQKFRSSCKTSIVGFLGLVISSFACSVQTTASTNLVLNGSFENMPITDNGGTFVGLSCATILTQCVSIPDWATTSALSILITTGPGGNSTTYFDPFIAQPPISAAAGANFIATDGAFGMGTLYQTISLQQGHQYVLSFDQATGQLDGNYGDTNDQFLVTIGGTVGTGPTNVTLPNGQIYSGASTIGGALYSWLTPLTFNKSGEYTTWQHEDFSFTAGPSGEDLLGFLATGAPLGTPPLVLLDDVSIQAIPELSSWVMMVLGFAGIGFAAYQRRTRKNTSALAAA